ncbi:radical SAM protein, partial [Chlamydiota bacterium]
VTELRVELPLSGSDEDLTAFDVAYRAVARRFRDTEDFEALGELLRLQVRLEDEMEVLEARYDAEARRIINRYIKCIRIINNLMLDRRGYRKYAVIPADNEEGWDIARLGFPGKWFIDCSEMREEVDIADQMQLAESLSVVLPTDDMDEKVPLHVAVFDERRLAEYGGPVALREVPGEPVVAYVSSEVLEMSAQDQEAFIKEHFPQDEILEKLPSKPAVAKPPEYPRRFKAVSFPLSSRFDYGHLVIGKVFGDNNIDVATQREVNSENFSDSDILDVDSIKNCDFLMFTLTQEDISINIGNLKSFLKRLRQENPNAVIVAGGITVTKAPAQVAALLPEVNVFVRGNDVSSFSKLLNVLGGQDPNESLSPEKLREIQEAYPGGGAVLNFGNTLVVLETDRIMHSALSLPRHDYDGEIGYIMASTGCPKRCNFCASPFGMGMEYIEVDRVYNWMEARREWLLEQRRLHGSESEAYYELDAYGVMKMHFADDNLCWKRGFIYGLAERIDTKKYRISFENVSIDSLMDRGNRKPDSELIEKLWDMGVREIRFGLDGLTNRSLRSLNKGYTLEEAYAVMNACKERGIDISFNTILTDPIISEANFSNVLMNYVILCREFKPKSISRYIYTVFGSFFTNNSLVREGANSLTELNPVDERLMGTVHIVYPVKRPNHAYVGVGYLVPNNEFIAEFLLELGEKREIAPSKMFLRKVAEIFLAGRMGPLDPTDVFLEEKVKMLAGIVRRELVFQGQYAEAITALEGLLEQVGADRAGDPIRAELAQLYRRAGRTEEATQVVSAMADDNLYKLDLLATSSGDGVVTTTRIDGINIGIDASETRQYGEDIGWKYTYTTLNSNLDTVPVSRKKYIMTVAGEKQNFTVTGEPIVSSATNEDRERAQVTEALMLSLLYPGVEVSFFEEPGVFERGIYEIGEDETGTISELAVLVERLGEQGISILLGDVLEVVRQMQVVLPDGAEEIDLDLGIFGYGLEDRVIAAAGELFGDEIAQLAEARRKELDNNRLISDRTQGEISDLVDVDKIDDIAEEYISYLDGLLKSAIRAGKEKIVVKILYHDDADGVASARIVRGFLELYRKNSEIKINTIFEACSVDRGPEDVTIDRSGVDAVFVVDLYWSQMVDGIDMAIDHHPVAEAKKKLCIW